MIWQPRRSRLWILALSGWMLLGAAHAASAALVRGRLERQRAPAPGITVTLYSRKTGRSAPAHSGNDGMYAYNNVAAGAYVLEVWVSRDPRVRPAAYPIKVVEPRTDLPAITVP